MIQKSNQFQTVKRFINKIELNFINLLKVKTTKRLFIFIQVKNPFFALSMTEISIIFTKLSFLREKASWIKTNILRRYVFFFLEHYILIKVISYESIFYSWLLIIFIWRMEDQSPALISRLDVNEAWFSKLQLVWRKLLQLKKRN